MQKRQPFVRNLWGLTVLCLLREKPNHPYELRRLIVERNKGEFLDLKRGSLYHAVGRLLKAGLIEVVESGREGRRPERTVYQLTVEGKQELVAWLSDLIRNVSNDSRDFFAALSYLGHLSPKVVSGLLEQRLGQTEERIRTLLESIATLTPKIGRVLLLESEFAVANLRSESAWIRSVVDDIRSGELAWKFHFAADREQNDAKKSGRTRKQS